MINKRIFRMLTLSIVIAGLILFLLACGQGATTPTSTSSVTTGEAAKVVFTRQPGGGVAGSAFTIQPIIEIQDIQGKKVTGYKGTVKINITAGTGDNKATLLGATTVSLKNGTVEFQGLTINKTGTGFTLTASCENLTPAISDPLEISPGTAAKLSFSVQPAGSTAGKLMTPAPEVIVQDVNGNLITDYEGEVSVSAYVSFVASFDQYTSQPNIQTFPIKISGTPSVKLVNGTARFDNITSTFSAETVYLTAVCGSLGSATSGQFEIKAESPTRLEFTIQPDGCIAGEPFYSQPIVAIMDRYNNVVNTARIPITLSITPGSGSGGAILSGLNPVVSDGGMGGISAFEDLSIDLSGTGYTLTATADGLTATQSQPFDVISE